MVSVVLAMLPLAALLLCCFVLIPEGDLGRSASILLTGATPLAVFGTGAAVMLAWMFRSGRRLSESCAALPPVAEGDAARCFVCGAPLDVELDLRAKKRETARCGYCQADNLIDPKRLSAMAAESAASLGNLESAVRTEAGLSAGHTAAAFGCAGLLFLAAPCSCLVPLAAIEPLSAVFMPPPHDDLEYVVLRWGDRACVARVSNTDNGRMAKHQGESPQYESYPSGPTFAASELRGRAVQYTDEATSQQVNVDAIYGIIGAPSNAIPVEGGAYGDPRVNHLCLVDPPEDLPVVRTKD